MVRVLADSHARSGERFFRDLTPNERRISSFETLENKRLLALLVQQIEQLPPTAKKILAMYYHEDFKLSEIAACFGLSECQIDEIRTQTVDLLNNYLLSAIDSSKSV
jgi:DNA-directed RNA polymerase specialized sigma subunit